MLGRAGDLAAIGEINLHQVGRRAAHAGRDPLRALRGQDEITGLKRLNRHAAGRRAHQRPSHKAGVAVLVLDDVVRDELAERGFGDLELVAAAQALHQHAASGVDHQRLIAVDLTLKQAVDHLLAPADLGETVGAGGRTNRHALLAEDVERGLLVSL